MTNSKQSKGIKNLPEGRFDLEAASEQALPVREFQITVGWGDCDPAQIAYTARIPEWSLTAIEAWYRYCLKMDWYDINLRRGIGTPFVSLNCQFLSPVTPAHPLMMMVYVSRLGNSSLSHRIEASQNNELCFTTDTIAAFVDAKTMQPIPVPPNMRSNIENYIQHQNRLFD